MSTNDKKYKPATQAETKQPQQNTAPTVPQTTAGRDANGNLVGGQTKENPFDTNLETWLTAVSEGKLKQPTPSLPEGVYPATNAPDSTGGTGSPSPGSSEAGGAGAGTNPGTNSGAGSGAPTFDDPYAAAIKAQYDAIVNRKPFSYNAAEDPMYQQYVDKYVQGGKLAMRDSMGQAAALTGGYGSSYGQAVGQQQYNEYMRNLADAMPELYGQAYEQYQDEGDRMLQNYQMLNEQSDDAYAKYRDAYSDYIYNEQMAYDRQQDAYKNLQSIIAATGMIPTADQLSASGMTEAEARALRMEYAKADPKAAVRKGLITAEEYKQITGKKYGSSSGGGGGSGSGGINYELLDKQNYLNSLGYNVPETGKPNAATEAAAADLRAKNDKNVSKAKAEEDIYKKIKGY